MLVESFVISLYCVALYYFRVNGETKQNAHKCTLIPSIKTGLTVTC